MKMALAVISERALQRLVYRQLRGQLFDVIMVADAEAAVRVLELRKPHLVCIDLLLPRASGYEVCEFIRSSGRLRDVPVLVMSDRISAADRAHAEEAGADGFLPKPFSIHQFSEQVRALMAGAPLSMRGLRKID